MNDLLTNLFLPLAASWGYWIIAKGFSVTRQTLKWTAGRAWPLALLLALTTPHANAGWFTRGPDPKAEAANQALERAAQIAAEAASTQAREHGRLLLAVEALSNERTQLAGHLEHLGTLAARDSAWAVAVQAAAPLLVAVAVLALGCAAIWMVSRTGSQDAELAAVLVDEIAGTGTGILVAESGQQQLRPVVPAGLEDMSPVAPQPSRHLETQEGELPL